MVTLEKARKLALALPEAEEKPSYGLPAFRVGGKLFAVLREKLDSIVLRVGFEQRDYLIEAAPAVFYTNDHYRNYPWVLAHLKKIKVADLRELLDDAWREAAPPKVLARNDRA